MIRKMNRPHLLGLARCFSRVKRRNRPAATKESLRCACERLLGIIYVVGLCWTSPSWPSCAPKSSSSSCLRDIFSQSPRAPCDPTSCASGYRVRTRRVPRALRGLDPEHSRMDLRESRFGWPQLLPHREGHVGLPSGKEPPDSAERRGSGAFFPRFVPPDTGEAVRFLRLLRRLRLLKAHGPGLPANSFQCETL